MTSSSSAEKKDVFPRVNYQPLQPHHLAHDLRGPLNSMMGFTELLLEGIEGPLNEIQQEDLAAIHQSAKNLLRLINAYVDLSRLSAGQLNIHRGPVSIAAALAAATEAVQDGDATANLNIVTALPEQLPHIFADRDRAAQMIVLSLEFLMSRTKAGPIEFSAEMRGSVVELTIAAAKAALFPEEREELFEQTVRIDAGGRSKLTAGGIYLPLARQLARLHDGNLTVAGSPETGTVFTLTLPVYRPD